MRTLKQDGIEKVLMGLTDISRKCAPSASSDATAPLLMSGSLDTTQILNFAGHELSPEDDLVQRLERLNAIGASLSAERDINRLLETILTAAKSITRADGGTLYRISEDQTLRFEIMRTELAQVLPWAALPAMRCRSTRSSSTRTASRTTAWWPRTRR